MSDNRNKTPYQLASNSAFWRTGVAEKVNSINYDIYKKKFSIGVNEKIATAGSCFAQHIGNKLRQHGFDVMDNEPMPWYFSAAKKKEFSYSIYSARYGNIYTVRQLLQLAKEAFGEWKPENIIWKNKEGRYVDALRPGVEPYGLDTAEEVGWHRKLHLQKVKALFEDMDILIFTFGLTEAWRDKASGTVYPIVPGSIAGEFDSDKYEFINFSYEEILADFIELMRYINAKTKPKKYLITVSPVPLTATATGDHVLSATTYSKSVLRAVAGWINNNFENVDYFPSYEIVINPWANSNKYEDNKRSVLPSAVDEVMKIFLNQHQDNGNHEAIFKNINPAITSGEKNIEDLICEEIYLDLLNSEKK